ncbi:MAG: transglutaminase-like domain-containing protein [Gemmatimonadales bacterium]
MLVLYRPSLRTAAASGMLIAWVASLGWLGLRQLNRTEATTLSSEAALRLAPGSVWYAVYAGSTQVGNAATRLDTLSPGYRVGESLMLETASGSGLVRVTRNTDAWLGATLNLERMQSRLSRDGRQADWTITVVDDTVSAHFMGGPVRTHGFARFAEAPTSSVALPYRLALGGDLVPGRTRTVTLLDGWPLGGRPTAVTVGREMLLKFADSSRADGPGAHQAAARMDSARVFSVIVDGAGGPRRLWIDRRGTVSGVETPLGIRWVRTDFDLSETEFRKSLSQRTDAIRAALPQLGQFAAPGVRRDTVTTPRRFLVQHRDGTPVDTSLLALLAGGRQVVHGDTLTVNTIPEIGPGESVRDTVPDPMIQSAGAIATQQRRMVTEPLDRQRLPGFVAAFHAQFRVDTSAGASVDALGTLGGHAGTPDGVTRLFVALLRASGVPARFVIGVHVSDSTMLTHAWAEIWSWSAGGWYAVDPVSGMPAANTGLIRLAFAGSSHPDELIALVANARWTELGRKEKP